MDLCFPEDEGMARKVLSHAQKFETVTEAALAIGKPRTTLRDWISRASDLITLKPPKVVTIDIETSTLDLFIRQYDLRSFKGRHDISRIVRDWHMLGAAWKFLDEKEAHVISVSSQDPMNDEAVVRKLHEVLSKADIVIGHNSDAFDLKKFRARAIYHGLSPLPKKQTIDTLKIARQQFSFTSNKLRYLADYLNVDAKDESPDWDACLDGDPKALSYMREYNKQDVVVTEEVYLKLRGWMPRHPNFNAYYDTRDSNGEKVDLCPACASPDLKEAKVKVTTTGRYRQYQCGNCGYHSSDGKNRTKVNLR